MATPSDVDLRANPLPVRERSIILVLSTIHPRSFNINIDVPSFLRHLKTNGVLNDRQCTSLCSELKQHVNETIEKFAGRVMVTLLKQVNFGDLVWELFEHGLNDLGNGIRDGMVSQGMLLALRTGADIGQSSHVMKMYVHWKQQIDQNCFRDDQLRALYERLKHKMLREGIAVEEQQKLANQCVVLARLRTQLCKDDRQVIQLIDDLKRDIPNTIDTFFRDLVYHGRNIVIQLRRGDFEAANKYAEEVEAQCRTAMQLEVLVMFHHRMVSVYRLFHSSSPCVEAYNEIIRHCEFGLHAVNSLRNENDIQAYFEQFFCLNLAKTLLGITQSFKMIDCGIDVTTSSVYLKMLERCHFKHMTERNLMIFYLCKARMFEKEGNRNLAREFIDKALDQTGDGLIHEELLPNIQEYKRFICERHTVGSCCRWIMNSLYLKGFLIAVGSVLISFTLSSNFWNNFW